MMKVKIKEDLEVNRVRGIVPGMIKYAGRIVHVTHVNEESEEPLYRIAEDGGLYRWNDGMFCKVD